MGPNADNAMGHFEHTGFLEIDEALLKHFGGSWDNPPVLDSGWENSSDLGKLRERAAKLLDTFAGITPWGWKEPRTTFLLRFWQELLPHLRYIICIRNPLEVARSLEKRDGISIPVAAQLWSQYTREAIRNTERRPRIITFYEDYFSDPAGEITRVVKFCGLEIVEEFSRAQKMISEELRHQTTGTVELLNEESVPLEHKVLYLGLRSLASEERCAMEIDDRPKPWAPNSIGSVLSVLDAMHDQEKLLQLEATLGEKEHQLSSLRARMRAELREKNQLISQLEDHNVRLQVFADAVRQTLAYRLYKTFIRPFRRGETLRGF